MATSQFESTLETFNRREGLVSILVYEYEINIIDIPEYKNFTVSNDTRIFVKSVKLYIFISVSKYPIVVWRIIKQRPITCGGKGLARIM